MDHAAAVDHLERFEQIAAELARFVVGQAALGLEPCLEGLAFEKIHDVQMQAAAPLDPVDHHDRRVAHLRQRLRLAHEARDGVRRGELGSQDFDGHQAIEGDLPGEVDGAHAAACELPHQLVVGRQRRTQTLEEG